MIPLHKISEKLESKDGIIFLKHVSNNKPNLTVRYAHRDDYYLFILLEKGVVKASIDFEEYEIKAPAIHYTLPGQVHNVLEHSDDIECWVLAADNMLVKDEYKIIFETASLKKQLPTIDCSVIDELKSCISILNNRTNDNSKQINHNIVSSLLSTTIGLIAEVFEDAATTSNTNRSSAITYQFKSLLSTSYKELKSPSQYAEKLNISPIYLNEVVKKSTGLTVSECIISEIVRQAKRLLFYTDKTVKEIAHELGYEDATYFTRVFTKYSSFSPTQFRKKHSK